MLRRALLSLALGLLSAAAYCLLFVDATNSAPVPLGKWQKQITNSIGMKLVCIPPGKFTMGSPKEEMGRGDDDDEHQHMVEISKGFWLGEHEVTQKQFREVMGYNPSYFSRDGAGKPGAEYKFGKPAGGKEMVPTDTSAFPVENVSWEEATAFCEKLSAQSREQGRKYRLPTEAEWEYACRGSAASYQTFHFGNSLASSQANFNSKYPIGWGDKGDYLARTCQVGTVGNRKYEKNAFGLSDMHGNVWEWCSDWYSKDYYSKSPRRDPQGPSGPSEDCGRVFRGGSWDSGSLFCRSANRNNDSPADRSYILGFRVALSASRHGVD